MQESFLDWLLTFINGESKIGNKTFKKGEHVG